MSSYLKSAKEPRDRSQLLSGRRKVKKLIFDIIFMLVMSYVFTGCSNGGDSSADNIVACRLDDFNQCFEWINLTDALVDSLGNTCVNDDKGTIIESCPTENVIGICEQLDDPLTPDLLNYFYANSSGIDPVYYASLKEQACIDAGGVWVLVN